MSLLNSALWVKYVPSVEKSLNSTRIQSMLNFSPQEVIESRQNQHRLKQHYAQQYVAHYKKYSKPDSEFHVGDYVRFQLPRTAFSKSYKPQWSEHSYPITAVIDSVPRMYKLQDQRTHYYSRQLTRVRGSQNRDKREFIIVQERNVKGEGRTRSGANPPLIHQSLVKSIYDPNYSRWLTDSEVEKLEEDGVLRSRFVPSGPENLPAE